ncbi:phage tail tape measure protein [Hymenobacter sp. RP-2-7]|uniref:Phage tail tape measure protein n=1 Tax=Hymenobacter polaris TaxID=2682546 RepID=A0A7Y0AHP6_9BACT|nr:phage tail tape measure protein [Hymenobacter polaris]NML67586.1 phage tail tape measure protein [Hymenobacter polaris]
MGKPISLEEFFDPNLGSGAQLLAEFTASIQGLSRNYRNFAKNLEADGGRVKAALADISTQGGQLAGQIGAINMASEQERVVFAALNAQIVALRGEQQRLQQQLAEQAKAQQVVNDATKQAQSASRALQNELREAYKSGDTARITAAATAIRTAKTETTALSQALRGTNSELTAARGSYDALDAQNKRLIATLKALDGGLGGNEQRVAALQNQIAQNTAKLKAYDAQIGIFTRSVGDYKGGFASLVQELAKVQAQQNGLNADSQRYQQLEQKRIGFLTAAQKAAAQAGLSYEQANSQIEQYTAAINPTVSNLVRLEKAQQDVAKSAGTDSEEYRKLGFQIASTKKELDSIPASTEKAGGGFKQVAEQLGFSKQGLTGAITQLGVGLIGVQAILGGVSAAFSTDAEFQSALSSLSALTGAVGEDLQFMADRAEDLGPKVGKSAAEVLKAFELVGSAQPALLDSKENLAAVTEQALLLAAASKEELPAAAEALTGVMNQYSASAQEAGRYVNALAAGAKEGAATIPQTAESLRYFGVNAASANISVEKSVALIQLLAERSIKGEQAGTQLRAVLAKLAAGAKDTNPEVVGLSTALDNLAKQNLTTAQYTKLFGLENANSAKLLVANRAEVERLTVAVTGTSAANEQAAKQLDNISTAGSRFGAVVKNIIINNLDGLSRSLGATLNQFSALLSKLTGNTKSVQENTAATAANGLANQQAASTAQALLERYQDLTAKGVKPAKDGKGELNLITLQLRDSLGESAAAIDKETGQLVLNEAATKRLISQKLLLSNQAVSTLVLEADALKAQQQQEQLNIKALEQQISTREKLLGITAEQARAQADDFANNMGYGELSAGVEQLSRAQIELGATRGKLAQLTADYNTKLDGLAKLNARAAYETGLFAGVTNQAAQAQTGLGAAAGGAEVILDRAAKAQAEQRRTSLAGQLSDTQKRIDDLKKLQTEQGKLFDDKQLSPEVFRVSVATTQNQITALERQAAATRIAILRTERDEKLIAINDEAIKAKRAKGVSAAELTDIEQAAAIKRLTVQQQYGRDVLKEQQALQDKLEVKPLEFKAPKIDIDQLTADLIPRVKTYKDKVDEILHAGDAQESLLSGQLVRGEITQNQYDRRSLANKKKHTDEILALDKSFHQTTIEDQIAANKDILERQKESDSQSLEQRKQSAERTRAIIDKVAEYAQFAEQSFFQIKGNLIDKQIQDENAAYENSIKVAGDNAELKEKIEKDHQKRLAKLNYDKAKAERDGALFSIAINTAAAVAKEIATYTFAAALPFIAADLALGAVQAAVVLSKPLPQYFKGREGGPAELAIVGDRGPELYGQARTGLKLATKPTVVQLQQHDVVYTAPETRNILAQQAQAVERIQYRTQQTDLQRTTERIQRGAAQQQAAALLMQRADTNALLIELQQVRRAIQEQEYNRLNEQGDLVRRIEADRQRRDIINKRHRPNSKA